MLTHLFLRKTPIVICCLLAGLAGNIGAGAAVQTHDIDPDTGLKTWRWDEGPFSLQLTQFLPDQTRAFFQGRGFAAKAANAISRSCVLRTIVGNTGLADVDKVVLVDLEEWRVDAGFGRKAIKRMREWQRRWETEGIPKAARIAFRWSLFPYRQEFLPGDANWGMIAFGPEPGMPFDLYFSWRESGKLHEGNLKGLQCAPDR